MDNSLSIEISLYPGCALINVIIDTAKFQMCTLEYDCDDSNMHAEAHVLAKKQKTIYVLHKISNNTTFSL